MQGVLLWDTLLQIFLARLALIYSQTDSSELHLAG